MVNKKIAVILVTLAVIFCSFGCKKNVGTPEDNAVVEETEEENSTAGGKVFGYSCPNLSEPYYTALKESVKDCLEKQGDKILVKDAKSDPELQNTQIDELIEEQVDGVFLCPQDTEKILPALEKLKEAEIPVINLENCIASDDLTDAFVGTDEAGAGEQCAQDLIAKKPEGGKLVIAEKQGDSTINSRITGFEEKTANKGFEVTRIDAGNDGQGITERFSGILSSGIVPDAVMCGDDSIALQILEVLENAGQNQVLVYSVGGSPEVKKELADAAGPMAGVAAKSPINMGKAAVQAANAVQNGEKYERETYVETIFVNRENLDIYGTDGWQ